MSGSRPGFHLSAPRNWLNDPNGLIFWEGRYHVFYQHNPDAPGWGVMRWGHASSSDLVTWTDHPVALAPTPGPDADGCWSGCGLVIDGVPTFFYTGLVGEGDAQVQSVCRASGDGQLLTLAKSDLSPLITPDLGEGHDHYRDPFVFFDAERGRWLMLLGSGIELPGQLPQGCIVGYTSFDTVTWEWLGVVFALPEGGAGFTTGSRWECPQFVRVGDDWVLVVSIQLRAEAGNTLAYAAWFVGDFDGAVFVPRSSGLLDGGDVFYAPAAMTAPDGRVLLWGWLQETAARPALEAAGVAGALSLPRELAVVGDRVVTWPAAELEALWDPALEPGDVHLEAGELWPLDAPGDRVRLQFSVVTDALAGVQLGSGDAALLVAVDSRTAPPRLVVLEPTRHGDGSASCDVGRRERASVALAAAPSIDLELYLDGTIVEVFVASGESLSTRRDEPADRQLHLVALGGPAAFIDVAVAASAALDQPPSIR